MAQNKKATVRPLPPLSFEVLKRVQTIEGYAGRELDGCRDSRSGELNTEKAERIARTCVVEVLDAMLGYYESLSNFKERWVREMRESAINSVLGMIPTGYGDDLYDSFYTLLAHTTYDHLNLPRNKSPLKAKTTAVGPLNQQIDSLRRECRLTVEQLAEEVDITWRSVYRHLSGKSAPGATQISAYEKLFSAKLGKPVRFRMSG